MTFNAMILFTIYHYSTITRNNVIHLLIKFFTGGRNPRLSTYNYQDLPPPRIIGNILFSNHADETAKSQSNYFAILFGQFNAHDIGERTYYQLRTRLIRI